jgi:FtsH-binding integral membrane protein
MMTGRFSRETGIGIAATLLAVAAMAVDHLVPGDPGGFAIGSALSVVLAAGLFAWLVPRAKVNPERAATTGLMCSALAVIPGIALIWLGLPFVLAGSGIALGLVGREGKRRGRAIAAVLIGAAVLVLGAAAYAVGGSDVTG